MTAIFHRLMDQSQPGSTWVPAGHTQTQQHIRRGSNTTRVAALSNSPKSDSWAVITGFLLTSPFSRLFFRGAFVVCCVLHTIFLCTYLAPLLLLSLFILCRLNFHHEDDDEPHYNVNKMTVDQQHQQQFSGFTFPWWSPGDESCAKKFKINKNQINKKSFDFLPLGSKRVANGTERRNNPIHEKSDR